MNQRVFLVGASGRYAPAGVGAELTHFAGNGFERRRIAVPQGNFFGFGRPHGRLFLWLRGAQTKGFSEGEKFLGQPLAAPFWILAAIGGFDVK